MINTKSGTKGFVEIDLAARFWSKVTIKSKSECWTWNGACNKDGRGIVWRNGAKHKAPRVAWFLTFGEDVPSDLSVCHSCDNPSCVNPKHLWIGTHKENMTDSIRKGRFVFPDPKKCGWRSRLLFCKRGHPFNVENTIMMKSGSRACRTCQREHQKRFYKKTHPKPPLSQP